MSESSVIKIVPKAFDKSYLQEHGDIIFHNRELIIEKDEQSVGNVVLRFKLGDGVKSYNCLQYISSLYALFPEVCLYDSNYENGIKISMKEE